MLYDILLLESVKGACKRSRGKLAGIQVLKIIILSRQVQFVTRITIFVIHGIYLKQETGR
jgi:hypothetical protein